MLTNPGGHPVPEPSLFRRSCAAALIILAVIGVVSINRFGRPDGIRRIPVAAGPDIAALPVVRSTSVGRPEAALASQYRRLDPLVDGWASEAFNTAAESQFKKLGELLTKPATAETKGSGLAAADFRADPLRPANLRSDWSDAIATVRRLGRRRKTPVTVSSLPVALDALRKVFPAGIQRAKFKIVRAELKSGVAETTVLVQIVGRSPTGAIQQNATWECEWTGPRTAKPRLKTIRVREFEEVARRTARSWFEDRTAAVLGGNASYGMQLIYGTDHWRERIDSAFGLHFTGHHGVAIGDVNGDGLDDLYVCQTGGLPNRLFQQNRDGTATDISRRAGVDWLDISHAALFVDLDNDGDQDLVVGVGDYLVFMENDGTGKFAVKKRIPTNFSTPMSLAAADYDNDGFVDVYVCIYDPANRRTGILDRTSRDGGNRITSAPALYHDANNGGENLLIRNTGNWVFQDVTKQTGLDVNNHRFTFAASWEDFDDDGDVDLYVANDYGRNNLYRNDGGRFTDIAEQAGVEDVAAGMSASWGDYNNDGSMDLYVGNMFSSAGSRVTFQRRFKPGLPGQVREEFQRHARGNSLFQNMGNGRFRDVSMSAGVTVGRWAWGSNFVDLNNDGREDLIVANGYVTQQNTGDL
jgi:FG-GAP-like repeat